MDYRCNKEERVEVLKIKLLKINHLHFLYLFFSLCISLSLEEIFNHLIVAYLLIAVNSQVHSSLCYMKAGSQESSHRTLFPQALCVL